jgi:hypothetical protein
MSPEYCKSHYSAQKWANDRHSATGRDGRGWRRKSGCDATNGVSASSSTIQSNAAREASATRADVHMLGK